MTKRYVIIDVREPDEYAESHVRGALNISLSALRSNSKILIDISKSAPIIVYCRSGNRSGVAKDALERMGYTNVINMINEDHISLNIHKL